MSPWTPPWHSRITILPVSVRVQRQSSCTARITAGFCAITIKKSISTRFHIIYSVPGDVTQLSKYLPEKMRLFASPVFLNLIRHSSSRLNAIGNKALVAGVTVTDDKTTFVAWHPDVEFPYELSKPIPERVVPSSSAVIEESAMAVAQKAFKTAHPEVARQELQRLTFTTKHKWYPRARDRKAKKTEMDRPYL